MNKPTVHPIVEGAAAFNRIPPAIFDRDAQSLSVEQIIQRRIELRDELWADFRGAEGNVAFFSLDPGSARTTAWLFASAVDDTGFQKPYPSTPPVLYPNPPGKTWPMVAVNESHQPDYRHPSNEEVGFFLITAPLISKKLWPHDQQKLFVSRGYALGLAQKHTRLGDLALARVFLRLAELEDRAWRHLKPRCTGNKRFRSQAVVDHSFAAFKGIRSCCEMAECNEWKDFAITSMQVFENAVLPGISLMEEQQTGRGPSTGREIVIAWIVDYLRSEGHAKYVSAEDKMVQMGVIKWEAEKDGPFTVRLPRGDYTKEPTKYATLKTWFTEARKKKKNGLGVSETSHS